MGMSKTKVSHKCVKCGKERILAIRSLREPGFTGLCNDCARRSRGKTKNPNWGGGRYMRKDGYSCVRVYPDDFYFPMTKSDGYVLEHRLVMAKHLGRNLQSWESVHHKNGIKTDNRIENLELSNNKEHIRSHNKGYTDGFKRGYIDGKEKRIQELLSEISRLRADKREVKNGS